MKNDEDKDAKEKTNEKLKDKIFKRRLLRIVSSGILFAAIYLVSSHRLDPLLEKLFETKPKPERKTFMVFDSLPGGLPYHAYTIDFYNRCLPKSSDICDNLTAYELVTPKGRLSLELKISEGCSRELKINANNHKFDAKTRMPYFDGMNGEKLFAEVRKRCVKDQSRFVSEDDYQNYQKILNETMKEKELDLLIRKIMWSYKTR